MNAICRFITRGACIAILALAGAGGYAAAEMPSCGLQQAGPSCAGEQPAGMGSGSGVKQDAGNPINLINGNKYQREADMAPLPGILGLELVRHYNSHFAAPGMPPSGAGRGWQFSYDTRLYLVGESLQLIQADGARLMFSRTAWSSTLCTAPDPAHGQVRIVGNRDHQEYRWRWPNGRELYFDRNGRLTHIFAPSGEWVSIMRDQEGRMMKVSDPQGRSMVFHYLHRKDYQSGSYRGVQSVDTPVGRFVYDYDAPEAGSTGPGHARRARLTAVHLPTSHDRGKPRAPFALGDTPTTTSVSTIRRIYHYEDHRFPTLLTGITVEGTGSDGRFLRERIATWAYDGNGLAVLSVKGEPARKDAGGKPVPGTGIEQISIDRGTPGLVRLINSLGQVTVYRHAIVGGDYRVLEARGPGCAACGDTDVRYRYDRQGRLLEVTRLNEAGAPKEGRRLWLDALGRTYGVSTVSYLHGKPAGSTLAMSRLFAQAGPDYSWSGPEAPQQPFGPQLTARASIVPGKDHQLKVEYNQRQQAVRVVELGFNPLDGSEISRSTRYRYQDIGGRSVLAEVDGPLPNGPAATPADSDISLYEWDPSGSYVKAMTLPGGGRTALEHDPHTGRVTRMVRDDGKAIALRYNSDGRIAQITETGPGLGKPVVLGMLFDARGRQTGSGAGIPGQADWRFELLSAFDAAGRPAWTASAAGMAAQWRHDTEGRLQGRRISSGRISRSWQYAYDERGRIVKATDPAGAMTQFGYGLHAGPAQIGGLPGKGNHRRLRPQRRQHQP
jgi:YD repeat-containing protein